MRLILASTSPRRHELLTLLGLTFEVVAPPFVEQIRPHLSAEDTTTNTATVTGHFIINNQASASAPQDPGGPVTDNAISDVVVTATDSVTVVAENRLIFLPLLFRD